MASPEPGNAYTPEETAKFLRWEPGALRKQAQLDRIPHTRLANRWIRFTADDIAAILAAGQRRPVADQPAVPAGRRRSGRPASLPAPSPGVRPLVARPGRRRGAA
jgi:hypothetical protein